MAAIKLAINPSMPVFCNKNTLVTKAGKAKKKMCKIAEYTDEMQMFYETKAQAVLMSCYDDQRNTAVFQAFCESKPCVGNNSENHGKMVHVKPKCLGEGLGSMRVQSVHVTHVLAE